MEEETIFLFVPYIIKNKENLEEDEEADEEDDVVEEPRPEPIRWNIYENPIAPKKRIPLPQVYLYEINRACLKKSETGERFKRTAIHFEPVVGKICYIIKIINAIGGASEVYFPFIFELEEQAIKEVDLIKGGEYKRYLHSKEKFLTVEIESVKITEY